ncbi:MAG TPA: hypothetical protein VN903_26365 [Polyangia bacterium]|nr:hypothetical protein [Polyangia bacterium]
MRTIRGALLSLAAGIAITGLAVVGCGGKGSAAPDACSDGQACGDGGPPDGVGPATCGNVQPCGGDVIGNWTFVQECESPASFAAAAASFAAMAEQSWCVGQSLVAIGPAASGSLLFSAEGTYSLALVFGGTLDINYPASCLAGVSCDDATAGFQSQIADGTFPMPNVTSIACSGSSNCVCRAVVNVPRSDTGTFSVSGTILTLTAAGGGVTSKSYCVADKALHILDTAMRTSGQTDIDSDLVAMKQ